MLPIGDVFGQITLLGGRVVDLAQLTAVLTGRNTIETDVELLTIARMRIARVEFSSCLIGTTCSIGRALEPIIQSYKRKTRSKSSLAIILKLNLLILSSRRHPDRLLSSGHTHVALISSKTSLAGQSLTSALPSVQVKN